MFVINPDPFLVPSFRISPFTTEYLTINNLLPNDDFAVKHFDEKFGEGNWQYTYNGREAIELALQQYKLESHDLVTILTTSGNFYISSCVTKSIEKFCRWNREITDETKLIFINHEFGYPFKDMEKIIATGIPVIEDCCTTFFSQDNNRKVGKYGDFSVYSLPKFFPLQIGGLLVNNTNATTGKSTLLDDNHKRFIQNAMSSGLKQQTGLLNKRKQNLDYALSQFSKLGFTSRFQNDDAIVPSALLLNNNSVISDLDQLKISLAANGIQNSIFYGEDAFFVPCHQNMTVSDIDYIVNVVKSMIDQ